MVVEGAGVPDGIEDIPRGRALTCGCMGLDNNVGTKGILKGKFKKSILILYTSGVL